LRTSDATLVLRTLKGDKSAFSELYDRYAGLVRAICNDSTRDRDQAADLAQEVFLRAYSKLDKLKDTERFGPWLASIARNVGREFRRGRFRDRLILVGQAPEEPYEPEAENPYDRLSYLEEAISKLTERERLALHAYYLQGQDVEQATKLLQVSRSGLYRLLARARERLEQIITEREKSEGQ
jgi:RNA polymerase sigma factor (sigma-70 family)